MACCATFRHTRAAIQPLGGRRTHYTTVQLTGPVLAVPNPASAREEGSGTTAGGREAAARGAVGRCPGSGPGRDGSTGALPSEVPCSLAAHAEYQTSL